MAAKAVKHRGVSIALACRAFGVSETCYRDSPLPYFEMRLWPRNMPDCVVARSMPQNFRNCRWCRKRRRSIEVLDGPMDEDALERFRPGQLDGPMVLSVLQRQQRRAQER